MGVKYFRLIGEIDAHCCPRKTPKLEYFPNRYRIAKGGIRKRVPDAKHYIVYPDTLQGRKDLDINMRREARVGRSSDWQMVLGRKPPLNSKNRIKQLIQKEQRKSKNLSAKNTSVQNGCKI